MFRVPPLGGFFATKSRLKAGLGTLFKYFPNQLQLKVPSKLQTQSAWNLKFEI